MKRLIIKVLLLIVLVTICISVSSKTYATYSIENIFTDAQSFLGAGNAPSSTINTTALHNTSTFIYKTLLAIGIIVATIVGIVLGIQFMIASAADKAKVKEALVAYVISCLVLFGAFSIWSIVINIVQETTGGEETYHSETKDEGGLTPPATGFVCPECNKDMGEIPAAVIAGGRTYPCPHCKKQVKF